MKQAQSELGREVWFRSGSQVVPLPAPDASRLLDPPDVEMRGITERDRDAARRQELSRWAAQNKDRISTYLSAAERIHHAPERLTIDVRRDSVVIDRDGALSTCRTNGRTQEIVLFRNLPLDVSSEWEGDILKQRIGGRHGLKLTLEYRPQGVDTVAVVLGVLSPELRPPVRHTRVYVRAGDR